MDIGRTKKSLTTLKIIDKHRYFIAQATLLFKINRPHFEIYRRDYGRFVYFTVQNFPTRGYIFRQGVQFSEKTVAEPLWGSIAPLPPSSYASGQL